MTPHEWPDVLVPGARCHGCHLLYDDWDVSDNRCPRRGDIWALLVEVDAKLDRILAGPGHRSFIPLRCAAMSPAGLRCALPTWHEGRHRAEDAGEWSRLDQGAA